MGPWDAGEYKHVVLGLIFLKYISDAFEELHAQLSRICVADPEDREEYLAENVFWVPRTARWLELQNNVKQPTIGKLIDEAMDAIEKDNPSLKGVLSKDYMRPTLDKQRLGELVDLIGNVVLGDEESRSKDVPGRVYEHFLGRFASAEGKLGGEFYTPASVVRLLVDMIEPYKGRVFDPCCGSGGMFVGIRAIRARPWRKDRRHSNLRTGEQPLSMAPLQDESGNPVGLAVISEREMPTHSTMTCIRTSRQTSFLLIHLSMKAIGAAKVSETMSVGSTGSRRSAMRTLLGSSILFITCLNGDCRFCTRRRVHEFQPIRRRRDPQEHNRSRPAGLHDCSSRTTLLYDSNSCLPLVSHEKSKEYEV